MHCTQKSTISRRKSSTTPRAKQVVLLLPDFQLTLCFGSKIARLHSIRWYRFIVDLL